MSYISNNNFYTVKEVSSILRLSVLTIYKYIRERKLSVVKFGGHYRISPNSLNEFIDTHLVIKIDPPDYEEEQYE